MRWMYELVKRVVLWLGEHSEDSRLAIHQLEMISNLDPEDCISQLRRIPGFDRNLPMGPRFGKPVDSFFLETLVVQSAGHARGGLGIQDHSDVSRSRALLGHLTPCTPGHAIWWKESEKPLCR